MARYNLIAAVIVMSVIIQLPTIESSPNSDDPCPLSLNDDCGHYTDVENIHSTPEHIDLVSGDGEYYVTTDDVTKKYTIHYANSGKTKSSDFLMPGYSFGVDIISYNLVIYNGTLCYFPTTMNACEIEQIETGEPDPPWELENLPTTYIDYERNRLQEPINNSGKSGARILGNDGYGLMGDSMDCDDGLCPSDVTGTAVFSPDGKYSITFMRELVEYDDWGFNDPDLDGILIMLEVTHWRMNQSNKTVSGSVAIVSSEHKLEASETEDSEDVVGVAWAPDSKAMYVITTNDIYLYSINGDFDSMSSLFDSNDVCSRGEVSEWNMGSDIVDFNGEGAYTSLDGSTLIFNCRGNTWIATLGDSKPFWSNTLGIFCALILAVFAVFSITKITGKRPKEIKSDNYQEMTVANLKKILQSKGLPVSGLKDELVNRLRNHVEDEIKRAEAFRSDLKKKGVD